MTGKLPTVPEEHNNENMYKSIGYYNYVDLDLIGNNAGSMEVKGPRAVRKDWRKKDRFQMSEMMGSYNRVDPKIEIQDLNSAMPSYGYETPKSLYQPTVISKPAKEDKAQIKLDSVEPSIYAPKPPDDLYQNYMLSDFKVPQQNANASQTQQGYKFPSPAAPNLKFSSKVHLRRLGKTICTSIQVPLKLKFAFAEGGQAGNSLPTRQTLKIQPKGTNKEAPVSVRRERPLVAQLLQQRPAYPAAHKQ